MIELEKLQGIKDRFLEVTQKMSRPEIAIDPRLMTDLGREHTELSELVNSIKQYEAVVFELKDLTEIIDKNEDSELVEMARDETESVEERIRHYEEQLRFLLIPRDPEDAKDAIVEIRAGTGGDEASLFAGDLLRLYSRYAEQKGWRMEVLESSQGTVGGFKEVIFSLKGKNVYGTMKYESGVHRVQRVPMTESSGRIHTSAATVAVLLEAEPVDVSIQANELKIDVYRSSGPGGQSVNTTDSAVRITHIPTGLVVTCQDEKSQHKNKDKALRVLRSRLYEMERAKLDEERSEARRSMVSSGDRSAKIRTYNYPQGRVTDHRLEGDQKNHALEKVIDGNLDPIIEALRTAENADRLARI